MTDESPIHFATEEAALEAATKAMVLASQDVEMDNEDREAILECDPEASPALDDNGKKVWYALLFDPEFGGEGIVHVDLSIEWVG